MKRYKCSQLPPSVEGHYVYLASDVDHELSQMASAVECKGNEIVGLKARVAELENRLELWGTTLSGERVKLDFGSDGIACRNETIALLDGVNDGLRKRIAELQEVLRGECIYDVGQQAEQWYCMGCGKYADKAEEIQHDDCKVARALGL